MTAPNAATTAPADVARRAAMDPVPAVVRVAARIVARRVIAVVRKRKVTVVARARKAPVTVAISVATTVDPNAAKRPSLCRI